LTDGEAAATPVTAADFARASYRRCWIAVWFCRPALQSCYPFGTSRPTLYQTVISAYP